MLFRIILIICSILFFGFAQAYADESGADTALHEDVGAETRIESVLFLDEFCPESENLSSYPPCLKSLLEGQQEALKTIYVTYEIETLDKIPAELREQQKKILDEVQQNWLLYRDTRCQYYGEMPLVGVYPRLAQQSCLIQMTQERIDALSQEIDVSRFAVDLVEDVKIEAESEVAEPSEEEM